MGYRLTALWLLLPVLLLWGCSKDDENKPPTTNPNLHRITLTSPNGGESWIAGSSHEIAWTDSNVAAASVLFSEDGLNWVTLTASTAANSYLWTVPAVPSTSCRIKVMDVADSTVADASDSAFTVVYLHDLHLVTPNGGERWEAGTIQTIRWSGHNVGSVHVLFSPDSGAHWTLKTAAIADTILQWPVPATPSPQCLVKVVDAADSTVFDVSDSLFALTYVREITVRSPNGGESWAAGSVHAITWSDVNVTLATVQFSSDNGERWITLQDSIADTSYAWTVGPAASAHCLIRVFDSADSTVADVSDTTFSVVVVRSLTLLVPNGGEQWLAGGSYEIAWVDQNVNTATVQFSSDNGATWATLIIATHDNSFMWVTPLTAAATCLIKVMDSMDGNVSDVSDAPFALTGTAAITVTSPAGGEMWLAGSTQTIAWTSVTGNAVRIDFSLDDGGSWILATALATGTSYAWTLPLNTTTQGRVRVADATDNSVFDVSERFSIVSGSGDAASHTYTSETGGTFTSPGGARMTVPVGAVPQTDLGAPGTMVFSIEMNNDAPVTLPAGESRVSNIYRLGPEGFTLARPVEIVIPVTDATATDVRLWRRNPTTGQPEYFGADFDTVARIVRAQTYEFSVWFVTTGITANDAAGCLFVDNLTGYWLSLCVESYTLTYASQAAWLPEIGQIFSLAPNGTIGWESEGRWYLPQGTYSLCTERDNGGVYEHHAPTEIAIDAPWTQNAPVTTNLTVGEFLDPVEGRCPCVPPPTSAVGTSDIQVTLTWYLPEPGLDLDLWVEDPTGEQCGFSNGQYPEVTSTGGQLDRDNLCGSYVNGRPENIYWTMPPPSGEYIVFVDWWGDCGSGVVSQDITVRTVVQGVTSTVQATIADGSSMQEVVRFQIVGRTVKFLPPRASEPRFHAPRGDKPARAR